MKGRINLFKKILNFLFQLGLKSKKEITKRKEWEKKKKRIGET